MKYTYTGERVPSYLPTCVYEGWLDAVEYRLRSDVDNLYRYPIWKVVGWRIGYSLGRLRKVNEMEIIVSQIFKKNGSVVFSVKSERREECQAALGGEGVEFDDESFEWSCGLMAVTVKALLSSANPHKSKPKKKR